MQNFECNLVFSVLYIDDYYVKYSIASCMWKKCKMYIWAWHIYAAYRKM